MNTIVGLVGKAWRSIGEAGPFYGSQMAQNFSRRCAEQILLPRVGRDLKNIGDLAQPRVGRSRKKRYFSVFRPPTWQVCGTQGGIPTHCI